MIKSKFNGEILSEGIVSGTIKNVHTLTTCIVCGLTSCNYIKLSTFSEITTDIIIDDSNRDVHAFESMRYEEEKTW